MFRFVTSKSIDAHPYCYRNTSIQLFFFIFRILFTAFYNGTLISFSLRTKEVHTYKGGEYGLRHVESVALDYVNQMIYVITFLASSDSRSPVWLDYADTVISIVYQGPYEPHALDVFKESIVWTNANTMC